MREKIVFIDLLVMAITLLLLVIDYILEIKLEIFDFMIYIYLIYLCIILFYYSLIKSILGIILFLKNVIQKNIVIESKKILILFIPSLLLIIYIVYFSLDHLSILFHSGINIVIESIILIFGCLTLLSYYILNKILFIKLYNKIILAVILPISYFIGYYIMWSIIRA
jgi:hypothetical protein